MADLNSLIAQGFQFQAPPDPFAQYAKMQQLDMADQSAQLNRMKMDEYRRSTTETNALRGLNPSDADYVNQLMRVNPERGIAYMKEKNAEKVANSTMSKTQTDVQVAKQKMESQAMRDASADPSDDVIKGQYGRLASSGLYTPEEIQQHSSNLQYLLTIPYEQRRSMLAQQGAPANDLKPTTTWVDQGTTKSAMQTPAFGGKPVNVGSLHVNVDPNTSASISAANTRAANALNVQGAGLPPEESAALSKAIVEGRLDPNRVNGRNAKILAATLTANPTANLLELGVSASGATAAERSLATQTAKMSTAATEANQMVGVVRDYSSRVDRTNYPTINSIENAVSKGTGDKNIVQLNTSINALINSYARAISPTGQPTVSDKNHARDIINSAYSTGQIGAILDVMQQEMSIARNSAGTASTELKVSRETARGRPPAATPAGAPIATQGSVITHPSFPGFSIGKP